MNKKSDRKREKTKPPEINGRGTLLIFNTGGLGRRWREREGVLNFKHFIASSPLLNHPSTFVLLLQLSDIQHQGLKRKNTKRSKQRK
ncbi:hypothetical protein CDAR_189541 [Caerostris darwini]|uniref:Uncharacterized protein n=1 Tax=Caerostris darwini TaxID=1538125 RepID=A0AAV4QWN8_9ARAC|nr:hypothetical protein CDAR_189541 [Caerostris darwini]